MVRPKRMGVEAIRGEKPLGKSANGVEVFVGRTYLFDMAGMNWAYEIRDFVGNSVFGRLILIGGKGDDKGKICEVMQFELDDFLAKELKADPRNGLPVGEDRANESLVFGADIRRDGSEVEFLRQCHATVVAKRVREGISDAFNASAEALQITQETAF